MAPDSFQPFSSRFICAGHVLAGIASGSLFRSWKVMTRKLIPPRARRAARSVPDVVRPLRNEYELNVVESPTSSQACFRRQGIDDKRLGVTPARDEEEVMASRRRLAELCCGTTGVPLSQSGWLVLVEYSLLNINSPKASGPGPSTASGSSR